MLQFDGFYSAFLSQPYFSPEAQSFWLWRFFPNNKVIKFYYWGDRVLDLQKTGQLQQFVKQSINSLYFNTPQDPSNWQLGDWKYTGVYSELDITTYYQRGKSAHDHRYYATTHYAIEGYQRIFIDYYSGQKGWRSQFFNNQGQFFRFYQHQF